MFGFLIGVVAVGWGVMIAVLDQPAASGRHLDRLCVALLIGGPAVAIAAGVTAATVHR